VKGKEKETQKGKEKETQKGKISSVEGRARFSLAHFIRLPHVKVTIRSTAREGQAQLIGDEQASTNMWFWRWTAD
jgi:hypothetical protein